MRFLQTNIELRYPASGYGTHFKYGTNIQIWRFHTQANLPWLIRISEVYQYLNINIVKGEIWSNLLAKQVTIFDSTRHLKRQRILHSTNHATKVSLHAAMSGQLRSFTFEFCLCTGELWSRESSSQKFREFRGIVHSRLMFWDMW